MAKDLDAENQRISNFQCHVTLTFTLDLITTDRQKYFLLLGYY